VVREEDGAEPAAAPLVFACYVTGHGLGHATRVVEVRIGVEDAAPLFWKKPSTASQATADCELTMPSLRILPGNRHFTSAFFLPAILDSYHYRSTAGNLLSALPNA
jgi:hypothetical protein